MDIADSQQTKHRFDKLIAAWRAVRERARELLPARWIVLLVGIGCLAYSQYMIEQGQPLAVADRDKGRTALGYAATNSLGILLDWKVESANGWRSLIGMPVRNILILLLVAIC